MSFCSAMFFVVCYFKTHFHQKKRNQRKQLTDIMYCVLYTVYARRMKTTAKIPIAIVCRSVGTFCSMRILSWAFGWFGRECFQFHCLRVSVWMNLYVFYTCGTHSNCVYVCFYFIGRFLLIFSSTIKDQTIYQSELVSIYTHPYLFFRWR